MPKILITSERAPRDSEGARMLREAGCELVYNQYRGGRTEPEMIGLVRDVDAVIAGVDPFTEPVFAAAERLKIVARTGVGYDAIDVPAATRHGVAVTIGVGTNDRAVADATWGLLLGAARSIPQHDRQVRSGGWKRQLGFDVWQKTIGIVGTGRIGKGVAKRATGFEMRILVHDVIPDQAWAETVGARYVPLDELLRESDFVTIHAPLMAETRGLIGERALRLMKPTAFIVNTARGGLIDEAALHRALSERSIAGAALDVVEVEPPVGPHPFADLDNVVITPHLAGGTYGAAHRMGIVAAEEVLSVLGGGRPRYAVNPEVLRS